MGLGLFEIPTVVSRDGVTKFHIICVTGGSIGVVRKDRRHSQACTSQQQYYSVSIKRRVEKVLLAMTVG